jgi:restriction system protein
MAIPDYQSLMLPLLTVAADGQDHHIRPAINQLADQFGLTDEERKELLPSGVDGVFDNRVGWARTYLKKAVLIKYPKRGFFRITDRGKSVVAQHPARINVAFLRQYPEFVEFQTPKKTVASTDEVEVEVPETGTETPEELLSSGYLKLRKQVEAEILARVKACPPEFFERREFSVRLRDGE